MKTLDQIQIILSDLLDIEPDTITPETYIVRDLGAESIDLLELVVLLESKFNIKIDDNKVFLTRLRAYIMDAENQGKDVVDHLTKELPFLGLERIHEILEDIEAGPVLKIIDVICYIEWA